VATAVAVAVCLNHHLVFLNNLLAEDRETRRIVSWG